MGTRALISIKHEDNTCSSVWVNYDGTLEHVGAILKRFYHTSELVNNLIAGGNISSLGIDVGIKHEFNDRPSIQVLCINSNVELYTTYYARDRGDPLNVNKYADPGDLNQFIDNNVDGSEIAFLFDDKWFYSKGDHQEWIEL